MKHELTLRMRHPENFEDVDVHRVVDVELTHNGEPVAIVPSTRASVLAELAPFSDFTKVEEYMTLEGTHVYRGMARHAGKDVYFWVEKLF